MSKVGFWLTAALAAACAAMVRGATDECQALTDHYLEKHHKEAEPYTGSNMLYFLHVPRTAGRTFHSCLLKIGTHPARRCPKAYDHLRLTNMTAPACYLLSSHDDFSVVSMLPPDVAVINQLRDPLDRFLSAYEFAIEVAARSLKRPKNFRKKVGRIATEDVWPWSYLIPFFAEDMRPKVRSGAKISRQQVGEGKCNVSGGHKACERGGLAAWSRRRAAAVRVSHDHAHSHASSSFKCRCRWA